VPVAEVDGLTIGYQRAGRGPSLVLLHGFLFDSRAWRPQLEGLADDFDVVAWDAPGAGRSSDPPERFELRDWADCLAKFLVVAGVPTPAHILGLSWGGLVAQEFYRRHSGLVRSLVLADTYAGWRGSLSAEVADQRLAGCVADSSLPADEVLARYLPGMHGEAADDAVRDELAALMAGFHPAGFRLMATSLAFADTREFLGTVRVPALLVWGEADARSPLQAGREMAALMPDARLVVIPGAGHLSNVEAPEQFNAAVRDFCRAAT
jgi:pimeloyl-ACP methyl ester carboxylesterase